MKIFLQVLDTLAKKFGHVINSKGYKELPKHVRIIQGDGITYDTVDQILEAMKTAGFVCLIYHLY
jgi:nicotinamide phosphoribosyltransferase